MEGVKLWRVNFAYNLAYRSTIFISLRNIYHLSIHKNGVLKLLLHFFNNLLENFQKSLNSLYRYESLLLPIQEFTTNNDVIFLQGLWKIFKDVSRFCMYS